MNVLYVAKHDSGGNDDEGAIAHALRELGCRVRVLQESQGHWADRFTPDLLLFHKWADVVMLAKMRSRSGAIAFWYFDLVDYPADPSLAGRCRSRASWMAGVLPHVDLGFCTDGDWVAKGESLIGNSFTTGKPYVNKLAWLPQGADSRTVGRGDPSCPHCRGRWEGHDVLFTGIGRGGGDGRVSFVEEMKGRYGSRFHWVERGVHGRDLANLVASSRIVVAPDSPVTDRYWSNRVYNALGHGAFLLHPRCAGLAEHYRDGAELVCYDSRGHLHELVERYLKLPEERQAVSCAGLERTVAQHTYKHRCVELLKTVEGRLG